MEAVGADTREPISRPDAGGAGIRTALALALIAALTVAWGLIGEAAGAGLGSPLPPFFATWMPELGPTSLPWLILFVLAVAAALPLARGLGGPAGFLVGVTVAGLLARLALAATRGGADAWYAVFGLDPEAANEYLPALPALDQGVMQFLDRFAEFSPALPIHPSAHPPGLLLLTDGLGAEDPRSFAALVIVVGMAAVPLTYLAARRLRMEEGRARAATLMLAFSPVAMIYGVSSADALFATLGVAAALLLVAGGVASRAAGMVVLAIASFFSWALLAVGAFAALLVAQLEGLRRAFWVAAGSGLALLTFYGVLYAATGYDPLGVLAAAGEAYDLGISNARPWEFWVFGSPVAFFVALGLPVAWYAARALGTANAVAVALAAVVLVAAVLGFSKGENERIWLFFAPFACLAAAAIVPRERLPLVVVLLAAQALAVELTLETIW